MSKNKNMNKNKNFTNYNSYSNNDMFAAFNLKAEENLDRIPKSNINSRKNNGVPQQQHLNGTLIDDIIVTKGYRQEKIIRAELEKELETRRKFRKNSKSCNLNVNRDKSFNLNNNMNNLNFYMNYKQSANCFL